MEKLKMQTADMAERNIEILGQMFPNCLTEVKNEEGKIVRAIDFDKLRQELACEVVEGAEERYQFTWPDKRNANRLANSPTNKTLRPCREESVDFDNTENLYIEGDNLEVLKLLRENYLGRVKMIYIDPPYNTGNDFVYNDDFAQGRAEFEAQSGLFDDEGNRMADPMVQNTESNGRFHTDWLNMIYPRLKVAKDLLADDGVIFISIDDNEVDNLKKVCDEVFGGTNFIAQFVWVKKKKGSHLSKTTRSMTEYILCYAKHYNNIELFGENAYSDKLQPLAKRTNSHKDLSFPANIIETKLSDGQYKAGVYGEGTSAIHFDGFIVKQGVIITPCVVNGPFIWTQDKLNEELKLGTKVYLSSKYGFNVLRSNQDEKIKRPSTLIDSRCNVGTNEDAYEESINLFHKEGIMSYPKPTTLLTYLINTITYFDTNSLILDFFSGSATTAHAVMQLNAEDGGNRKFIMVQLPELTDEKSEAYKAGYKNICEIGKERIRRAGKKISDDIQDKIQTLGFTINSLLNAKPSATVAMLPKQEQEAIAKKIYNEQILPKMKEKEQLELRLAKLDTGFRVLKLDTSNMKDVYYTPADTPIQQTLGFDELVDNIKWDERTPEDLLFQVLPECNLPLSSKIEEREIHGKKVFVVEDGYLMACFDKDINESVITAIAKEKPYYFVMCDRSITTDNVADNFDQIFNAYSKETIRRIL